MEKRRKLKNRPAGRASVTWLAERRVYEVRCLAPDGAVITISEHSTPYDRMVSLTFECQCGAGFHKHAGQRRRQDDDQVDEVEHESGSDRDPVGDVREALRALGVAAP